MNKTCLNCGLANFPNAVHCRGCAQRFDGKVTESSDQEVSSKEGNGPRRWAMYLLLAILTEAVALVIGGLPFLAAMAMHHSSAAPMGDGEKLAVTIALISHLPTDLILLLGGPLVFLSPLTQLVFYVWLYSYIGKQIKQKS